MTARTIHADEAERIGLDQPRRARRDAEGRDRRRSSMNCSPTPTLPSGAQSG